MSKTPTLMEQIMQYTKNDMDDPVGVARTAAMMLISILCYDTNAGTAEMTLEDLTYRGEKLGSWKVTVEHQSPELLNASKEEK